MHDLRGLDQPQVHRHVDEHLEGGFYEQKEHRENRASLKEYKYKTASLFDGTDIIDDSAVDLGSENSTHKKRECICGTASKGWQLTNRVIKDRVIFLKK